jgi:hypothetical protein
MNSLLGIILCGAAALFGFYFYTKKLFFKKGKEEEQTNQLKEIVNQTIDIKKNEQTNRDINIDDIRGRMRKYTRD